MKATDVRDNGLDHLCTQVGGGGREGERGKGRKKKEKRGKKTGIY